MVPFLNTLKYAVIIEKNGLRACAFTALLLCSMHIFRPFPASAKSPSERIPAGFDRSIVLPDLAYHKTGGFSYLFQVQYAPGERNRFMLHPQGCIDQITLNYRQVAYDRKKKCDLDAGIVLNLDLPLEPGNNELKIQTASKGLTIGPIIFDRTHRQLIDWLGYALALVSCASLVLFMRRFTGEFLTGTFMSLGLLVYLSQFSHTGYTQFAHDIFGHLEYIDYIVHHGALPDAYMNFSSYHPPLYYVLQAALHRMRRQLVGQLLDVVTSMRALSLVLLHDGDGFLYGAYALEAASIPKPHRLLHRLAGITGKCFTRRASVVAARINSDLIFYTFFSACAYFLLRWLQESKDSDLAMTLAMLGLGIAARSNMLIMVPLIALAGLYQWRIRRHSLHSMVTTQVSLSIAIVTLGLLSNFGRTLYPHLIGEAGNPLLVGSAKHLWNIAPGLRINNTLQNLFLMNLPGYFRQPFWNVWWDNSDRPYFLNSLFKSSLLGEFHWAQPFLATALDSLLLVLIAYGISGIVSARHDREKRKKFLWAGLSCCSSRSLSDGLMLNRILNPLSCSQDFRYIYPCIVGFCAIFGLAVEQLHGKTQLHHAVGGGIILNLHRLCDHQRLLLPRPVLT